MAGNEVPGPQVWELHVRPADDPVAWLVMPSSGKSRILLLCALGAVLAGFLCAGCAAAQEDPNNPNQIPLGDLARKLRSQEPVSPEVIDNDNLGEIMRQAERQRASEVAEGTNHAPLAFVMTGESRDFQMMVPDATCSLSFNAAAKSLLAGQYSQMDLPPSDMVKLTGPAAIEGDALTVTIFNGTDWHLSELAVALMVVRKNGTGDGSLAGGATPGELDSDALAEVRPEKKADRTIIYKMRAAGPPWMTTAFSAPLGLKLGAGDEWHWAILQAKGYPPQSYLPGPSQTAAAGTAPMVGQLPSRALPAAPSLSSEPSPPAQP